MNEDNLYAFLVARMMARQEAIYRSSPAARTGDVVHIREWLEGRGEGEADPVGWEADRESSLYFDRLWLSEIGIKG